MDQSEKYDGFVTIPDSEENYTKWIYIGLNEYGDGTPVEGSDLGDMYHVILFKGDNMEFDESFEAILTSPETYAANLLPNFYGVFVRKTDKSVLWFKEYYQSWLAKLLEIKRQKLQEGLEI